MSEPSGTDDVYGHNARDVLIRLCASGTSSIGTLWLSRSALCARAPIFIELTHTIDVIEFPGWRLETLDSFVNWVKSGRVLVRGLTYDGKIDVTEALKHDDDEYGGANLYAGNDDGDQFNNMSTNDETAKLKESLRLRSLNRPWYSGFTYDPVAQILARTLDLYIFAEVGAIVALRTECILIWQRLLCAPYNVVLYSPLIKAAIDRIGGQENLLCQFIFEWTAFTIRDNVWEQANLELLPSDVLSKILRLAIHRANFGSGTEHGVADPNRDWCRYHGHLSQEERDFCCAGRLHDWDVQVAGSQRLSSSENSNEELTNGQDGCTANEQPFESHLTPAATPVTQNEQASYSLSSGECAESCHAIGKMLGTIVDPIRYG